jgi:hypothetical protein
VDSRKLVVWWFGILGSKEDNTEES